jgi:hypothetical protein
MIRFSEKGGKTNQAIVEGLSGLHHVWREKSGFYPIYIYSLLSSSSFYYFQVDPFLFLLTNHKPP